MIHLRSFRPCDWQIITTYQYPDMAQGDAVKLIDEFNALTFQGKFQKLLAIADDEQIVGYVSLIEQCDGVVSIGVEIYTPYRRKGYAYAGIAQLLTIANAYGYHTAAGQVRKDNAASLALCKKLGFTVVDEATSRRGKAVYNLVMSI